MKKPRILRKRFIPYETVDISGDELLLRSDELLITRWKVIHPRSDMSWGLSYAFLKDGFKISRFYDANDSFLCWYCDIIDFEYDEEKDTYTLIDLLVDVKISPQGELKVLDADELAEVLEKGLITQERACTALKKLDKLLKMIYDSKFPPDICTKEEYWEK